MRPKAGPIFGCLLYPLSNKTRASHMVLVEFGSTVASATIKKLSPACFYKHEKLQQLWSPVTPPKLYNIALRI